MTLSSKLCFGSLGAAEHSLAVHRGPEEGCIASCQEKQGTCSSPWELHPCLRAQRDSLHTVSNPQGIKCLAVSNPPGVKSLCWATSHVSDRPKWPENRTETPRMSSATHKKKCRVLINATAGMHIQIDINCLFC